MVCAAPAPAPPADENSAASRRARRQAKLKAEIFSVAVDLFAKKGYDAVTVDEIAAAADIAKGTFFNYFPTKEHLLLEYRRSLLTDIHAYGAKLEGDSARELVKKYFRRLSRSVRAEGKKYEMLFKEVVARPHLIAHDEEYRGKYTPYFARFIAIGKESGEIPEDCDERLLMETFRDIWTGTSVTWQLEMSSASLERLVLEKVDWLFDLLENA